MLTSADDKTLNQIREQKLLLQVYEPDKQITLANSYKERSLQVFATPTEKDNATQYADFTKLLAKLFRTLGRRARKFEKLIPLVSSVDLIQLAAEIVRDNATHFYSQYHNEIDRLAQEGQLPTAEFADTSEWMLHNLNGEINDLSWAAARALNESLKLTARSQKSLDKKFRAKVKDELAELIQIAGHWNALAYVADMLSYGEWFIEELSASDPITVKFAVKDIHFARAKAIGLRRKIIQLYIGRESPTQVRRFFQTFTISLVDAALEYYSMDLPTDFLTTEIHASLESEVIRWLNLLDIEDDLLMGAAKRDPTVLGHYLAAISLRAFSHAALILKHHATRRYKKSFGGLRIPLNVICEIISTQLTDVSTEIVQQWVESQIIEIPTSRHFDIITKPFIKVSATEVVGFGGLTINNWPPNVRAGLVKGGVLAKSYGQIWEDYVSDTFKKYGWKVLGRGIKIRRQKRILTDVDILVFKNGLLLIIQVKALASGDANIFEHWKSKTTICQGVEQAATATMEIKNNERLLKHLLASNAVTEGVAQLQPVVITNSPLFTGWSRSDIPVISFGYLMTLLHGAKVQYKDLSKTVLAEASFSKTKELTAQEFVQLLFEPVDWLIAKEVNEIADRWVTIENVRIAIPELRRS
jgi:hypothetical protein